MCKQISCYSFKNKITNNLSHMYNYLNVCKQMIDIELFLLHSNTWNHLTVCKKKNELRFVLKYYQQNV